MLNIFRRHSMTGGLYFGPAAWSPDAWDIVPTPRRLCLAVPAATGVPAAWPTADATTARGERLLPAPRPDEPDFISPCDGRLDELTDVDDVCGRAGQGLPLTPNWPAVDPSCGGPPDAPKSASELRALLQQRGVGVLCARTPSLLAQVASLSTSPDYLILNFVPQYPESRLAEAIALFQTTRLQAGITWLAEAIKPGRIIMAADRADLRSYRKLRKNLRALSIQPRQLLNNYPQGDPTVLLWSLLGRRLPVGDLPTHAGVVIADPVSLWALGAIAEGVCTISARPVEIFAAGKPPRVVEAPLGMYVSDLLEHLEIEAQGRQVIANGMLSGVEVDPAAAVIQQCTNCLSVRDLLPPEHSSPCFACGWCVDHCPTGINPIQLHDLAHARSGCQTADAREALHCIGCGLCSYVCPTRLPLMQDVLGLRGAVKRRREGGGGGGGVGAR